MKKIIFSLFMLLSVNEVHAESIVAVCKDPAGRSIGQHGFLGGGATVDEKDGMSGGVVTINWAGGEFADIVIQGASGTSPSRENALLILKSPEQFSFLVLYGQAVWLYSVFPVADALLISQHMNGFSIDSGGAINKALMAKCSIDVE